MIVLELRKYEHSRNNQENRCGSSNKSAEFYVWDITRLFFIIKQMDFLYKNADKAKYMAMSRDRNAD